MKKEISNLLSQKKWTDVARLIKLNGISQDSAFAAVRAGIEIDDEELVDGGVKCALKLLKHPSNIKLSAAYYNLGNAYQYKAIKYARDKKTYFGVEKIIKRSLHYFYKSLELKSSPEVATNLANTLDEIGRPLEALVRYEEAIKENPKFGMALGNKAMLIEYLSDISTYRTGYLIYAYQIYEKALKNKSSILDVGGSDAYKIFRQHKEKIKKYFSDNNKEILLSKSLEHPHYNPSTDKAVADYTSFCLSKNLYLNLHIFDCHSNSSIGDAVHTSLITSINDKNEKQWTNEIFMRLNEIKESYMTGRYNLWLSQKKTATMSAISEQSLLVNSLDYTAHNLYTGLLKSSYKEAFSVLDKIANFLNYYLKLGNKEDDPCLNYRNVWYVNLGKDKDKRKFHENVISQNHRLFGIYSILYELGKKPADVRNQLEHRYKRISTIGLDPYEAPTFDNFTRQTIDFYYAVKCAIIYLLNFVNYTESVKKAKALKQGHLIYSMPVVTDQWLDIWK